MTSIPVPRSQRAAAGPQASPDERSRIHQLWQSKLAKDDWAGWRALCSGEMIEGQKVPVDPNTPFTGYYRSKRQDKTFAPVAYWKDGGKWICLIDGRQIEEYRAIEQWPFIARYPISLEWYTAVAEEGKPWPDADDRTTPTALARSAEPTEGPGPREVIGGNLPPAEKPSVAMKNKIDNAKGGIKDYAEIKDDETLAKAKSLKNRLTELLGEAKKERDKLSRPHLDALDEIRAEWTPLVDDAAAGTKAVNNAMDVWATVKLKRQRAEEQRVAAELAAAEKIKRDNETRTKVAEATGAVAELEVVPEVKPAEAPKIEGTQVRAGYGRAGSMQTERYIVKIIDIDALFGLLKTHGELKDKMLELAGRALKAGIDPPGCEIDERAKIRG